MKRNTFLKLTAASLTAILVDTKCTSKKQLKNQTSVKKYNGIFEIKTKRNLINRITFGFTINDLEKFKNNNLDEILDYLLLSTRKLKNPLNYDYTKDNDVPIGNTWIHAPKSDDDKIINYRKKSLQAWMTSYFYDYGLSIESQMTLFFINHFGISDENKINLQYKNFNLCKESSLGNYKELIKKITVDPLMLIFLNGDGNSKYAPNENYAREFLELFTIGKGVQKDKDDFTYYTEYDVKQLSKIFTGWEIDETNGTSKFIISRHDNNNFQLSKKFNYKMIKPFLKKRHELLTDIIFEQEQTAIFFCKKIYRWFLDYKIDIDTEKKVIYPLAHIFIENNFEIKPLLKAFFTSDHFITKINQQPKIKNPYEYTFSLIKNNFIEVPLKDQNSFYEEIFEDNTAQGLEIFLLPSVSGLKAYYQEPNFYKLWLNAITLNRKQILINKIFYKGFNCNKSIKCNIKKFITLHYNNSIDGFLMNISFFLFSEHLTLERINFLKETLTNINMINENNINTYIRNEIDEKDKMDFENRITDFLYKLFTLPEFQLI